MASNVVKNREKSNLHCQNYQDSIQSLPDNKLLAEIKRLEDEIFKLGPAEVIRYAKLKIEAVKRELLNDEDLKTINEDEYLMKALTPDDIQSIEEERHNIRAAIFKQQKVTVAKKGTSLQVKINEKNKTGTIIIPTSWQVVIDNDLLVEQLDTTRAIKNKERTIHELTTELLFATEDIAITGHILSVISNTDTQMGRKLRSLPDTNGGIDKYTKIAIQTLAQNVKNNIVTMDQAQNYLGNKRRLMYEFQRIYKDIHED